jgi:hypothetical protein
MRFRKFLQSFFFQPIRRIGALFARPQYRVRLLVFILICLVLAFLAAREDPNTFQGQVLIEFTVTVGAVAALQILWDFLGGDPMEIALNELQEATATKKDVQQIDSHVTSLYRDVTLLGDMERTGIVRLWPSRKHWQSDRLHGIEVWKERIITAQEVDILSDSFWSGWLQYEEFSDPLEKRVSEDRGRMRILIFRPNTPALRQRAYDQGGPPRFLSDESTWSLNRLCGILARHPEQSSLEVRVNSTAMNSFQIIRADDEMIVASYLMRRSGSPSPTVHLRRGGQKNHFDSYSQHFDAIWTEAETWPPCLDTRIFDLYLARGNQLGDAVQEMTSEMDIMVRINQLTGLHEYTIRRHFDLFTRAILLLQREVPVDETSYLLGIPKERVLEYEGLYAKYNKPEYEDHLIEMMANAKELWSQK